MMEKAHVLWIRYIYSDGTSESVKATYDPKEIPITPDPAYARKKRVPKEWQEEWK